MIEVEVKARVRDPDALHMRLSELAAGQQSVYRDAYYDHPGRDLAATGWELRLRIIDSVCETPSLLTLKEPAIDAASGSKPEPETQISDPTTIGVLLQGLGLEVLVTFDKHCTNYCLSDRERDTLATVATVPELKAHSSNWKP